MVCVLLMLVLSFGFAVAAEGDEELDPHSEEAKIKKGFECLETNAGTCKSLKTEEIALTILATPDNIFDDCVNELEGRATSNAWKNVKDTSLAILALQHAGRNTTKYEEWLLEKETVPDNLKWYIQQDSLGSAECNIAYDGDNYDISVNNNKKITATGGIGKCLEVSTPGSYWISVGESCFEKDISMQCNVECLENSNCNFIASLLYSAGPGGTVYVLDGTQSASNYGSVVLNVKSKCFKGDSGSGCGYEETVWAALALLKTEHNIDDYLPYIIAMSETNTRLNPDAFVYMLTDYEDYASRLIASQKTGYWDFGSGSREYDTAISLVALATSSADQITAARNWLLFTQDNNGCWNNKVRDTAAVLWAIEQRPGRIASGVTSETTTLPLCTDVDSFCIAQSDCPSGEVMKNFYCSGVSTVCCENEHLKTCSEYSGEVCTGDTVCSGNTKKSLDVEKCCTGTCVERPEENECESNHYTCSDSCSEYQEELSYSCDGAQVCCRAKTGGDEGGSLWWIWIIVVVVLAVLGALAFVYREKIKEALDNMKKKDGGPKPPKGRGPPGRPGMPPRPGFPPAVRQQPPAPMMRRPQYREDPAMKETFRKLRNIAAR